ncbi:TonB-dependent receptor [Spirochaeta africana]|uniref:TonB-dependent receptor-like beta-barrel domain-containing protein n=1 Tax=Spirochaeta africana (strain ATCC 700263 / DSM 8902 / Z-7692) TaxID=889378 RepID=H9UKH5_SPIAZ|nr:TonB-dependent receptor [Spirochaeta africana]AFG38018.1 hypothetical protein Spiaf_1967 [Spirochaeta africana DSM 8902]
MEMTRFTPSRFMIIALLLLPLYAAGQSDAPEEPEIVLPTALLRVDGIPFERVEAVLPGAAQLVLPELVIPLPSVQEMEVQPRLLLPDITDDLDPVETSVFSTGSITAGSRNLIEGQLGVFKLGQDPRFRLTFSHQGVDGYGGKSPGTGFFRSEQRLDGWLGSTAGPVQFETGAGFTEWQEGLQQTSDSYYSTILRFLSGHGEVELRPDELIGVYGSLHAGSASRRLSVSETEEVPESDDEDYLQAGARVAVELPAFTLSLGAEYGLQALGAGGMDSIDILHDGAITVSFDAQPSSRVDLYGNAGALWLVGDRFEYPFTLGVNYRSSDWVEFQGSFGRRAQRTLLHDLWRDIPLLRLPAGRSPDPAMEWFAGGRMQADFVEQNLRLQGGVDYIIEFQDRVLPGAYLFDVVPDGDDPDAFPQIGFSWDTYDGVELQTHLQLQYQLSGFARLQAGYRGALPLFSTRGNPVVPQHLGQLGITLGSENGMYGGGADLEAPVYSVASLPYLDLHSYVQVTDGIVLRAAIRDLLAPLIDGDRYQFDVSSDNGTPGFSPFIEPGIRFTLSAEITL